MSQDIAIRIQGLGKRYRLGETVDLARNFRETLMTLPRLFGRKAKRALTAGDEADGGSPDVLWALRDVDLDVRRGEVIGIIGSNGAGKSTLLKIISRITYPTVGEVEIHGRVGSLLEVGTGMHPELTGRENVFLNGAILGMRKAEIQRRFDEIVAFAEVERFLDTPVKRYSSGMRVRLAFAVAAHLETEILLIDEVLSVGDAEFRRKCLGKMESVAGGGRTVLFVSHNMQAVSTLCQSAVLLSGGRIVERGEAPAIVQSYLRSGHQGASSVDITREMHKHYPPALEIFRVAVFNDDGEATNQLQVGEAFTVEVCYRVHQPDRTHNVALLVRTNDGVLITATASGDEIEALPSERDTDHVLRVRVDNILSAGEYYLDLKVKALQVLVDLIEGLQLSVVPVGADAKGQGRGIVQLRADWTVG